MRRFELVRSADVSGVSGVGIVAYGVTNLMPDWEGIFESYKKE